MNFLLAGLPAHPLFVHAAVVLLPLAVVAVIWLILKPSIRPNFLTPGLVLVWAAALSSGLAAITGEGLEEFVEVNATHEKYGKVLGILSMLLALLFTVWWRQARIPVKGKVTVLGDGMQMIFASATLIVSVAAMVLVGIVGHTGASQVWEGRITSTSTGDEDSSIIDGDEPTASETPTDGSSASPTPSASSTQKSYTAAEVAKHNSKSSCWTIIAGQAFDLTEWIGKHPGGASVIESICGIDGESAFLSQHDKNGEPVGVLRQYWLGPIA